MPTTREARRFHRQSYHVKGCTGCPMNDSLAAIEAEARKAERKRIAAAVEGLLGCEDMDNQGTPHQHVHTGHVEGGCGFRAAVLALLSGDPR
jgi:hypothetical protein